MADSSLMYVFSLSLRLFSLALRDDLGGEGSLGSWTWLLDERFWRAHDRDVDMCETFLEQW